MKNCNQTSNMNMLEHGESVHQYYIYLWRHLLSGIELWGEWKIPSWCYEHKDLILKNLYPIEVMREYHIFHDCGKPFCRTVDEEGKQHFPDHANKSAEIYSHISDDERIINLIRSDMDIHLLKADGLQDFAKRPEAISLLLTGLAEIHSNAKMFGGIESTSFKIKWKHIDKRGKQIIKELAG